MDAAIHLGHQTQVTPYVDGADGRARTVTLWIVRVDGDAYVRSLRGVGTAWYRGATTSAAQLWCLEGIVRVRFSPVADPAVLDRLDDAYREKYGLGWPGPAARAT